MREYTLRINYKKEHVEKNVVGIVKRRVMDHIGMLTGVLRDVYIQDISEQKIPDKLTLVLLIVI